jgi:hypothetical protein
LLLPQKRRTANREGFLVASKLPEGDSRQILIEILADKTDEHCLLTLFYTHTKKGTSVEFYTTV